MPFLMLPLHTMLLPFFCIALSLSSCSYNWGHQGKKLPGDMKVVAVNFFENQTPEVGVEEIFTNTLIKELRRSGLLSVKGEANADGYFQGKILDLSTRGSATTSGFENADGTPIPGAALHTVWTINCTIEISLYSLPERKRVWTSTFRQRSSYRGPSLKKFGLRSSNALYNQSLKEQNVRALASELIEEAFDKMTETY